MLSITNRREGKRMTEERKIIDQAVQAVTDREGKYLTFTLAEEEYSIGILKI